jgi:hypothetical protein
VRDAVRDDSRRRDQAHREIASDLIWENWDAPIRQIQQDVGLTNRDIQDALVRRYPEIERTRERAAARRDERSSKRSVERPRADRTKFEKAGSPAVRRVTEMARTVAESLRPIGRKIGEALSMADRAANRKKLQELPNGRKLPSEKRVGGSQVNCKERPESTPKKHKGRGGAKPVNFIPWCDETTSKRRR